MFFRKRVGIRWYDEGDLSSVQYTKDTLTIDGAWHDLDLSSIVGESRVLVLIQAYLNDNAGDKELKIRTKGNINEVNVGTCHTQVANKTCDRNIFVYTDVNGIIQYMIDVATWQTIDLVIRGVFK